MDKYFVDKCQVNEYWVDKYFVDKCQVNEYWVDKYFVDKCQVNEYWVDKYFVDKCQVNEYWDLYTCLTSILSLVTEIGSLFWFCGALESHLKRGD